MGGSNTFVGYEAGYKNYDGRHNTYLGRWSGFENTNGSYNVFVGTEAGRYEKGSNKLCVNAINVAGYQVPLIYGDFSTGKRYVVIDGDSTDNPSFEHKLVITGKIAAQEFVSIGKKSEPKTTSVLHNSLDKIIGLDGIKYTQQNERGINGEELGINPETAVKIVPEIVEDYGESMELDIPG